MTPLPATVSVVEAATLLGVSPDAVYDAAQRGEFATVRVGRRVRVALRPLLAACGVPEDDARTLLGMPSVMPSANPSDPGEGIAPGQTAAGSAAGSVPSLAPIAGEQTCDGRSGAVDNRGRG